MNHHEHSPYSERENQLPVLNAEFEPAWPPPGVESPPPHPAVRSRKRLAILLFIATCLSTFWVGALHTPPGELTVGSFVWNGLNYSVPVMLILLAHEMGHYLQARRYHVPASLPYFIPMPFIPFGTMGAVIVQGAGVADRKSLFDIAVSGPLAGLVVALPVTYAGVLMSHVEPVNDPSALIFGDPLILQWMITAVHGAQPPGYEVILNPLLFAGWVGIFVTALNLVPIGQLDGGHILYTLIGKRAHHVAVFLLCGAVGAMIYTGYPAYALMVVLLIMMGPKHPPTADDYVPLGAGRVILGWLTLAFLLIGFTPVPIKPVGEESPPPPPPPARTEVAPLTADMVNSAAEEALVRIAIPFDNCDATAAASRRDFAWLSAGNSKRGVSPVTIAAVPMGRR